MAEMTDGAPAPLDEILRSYRTEDDAQAASARLQSVGVEADELIRALSSMGDSLLPTTSSTVPEAIREALLAAEVQAYTGAAYRRASAVRAEVLDRALQDTTLAAVAAELGVSRQAVFKIVKNRERTEAFRWVLEMPAQRTDA